MSNSVVVVTGGSGGIGQALIKKYLQEGYFVISADTEKNSNFEYKNFLNLSNPMINKRIPDIAYPIQEKGIS